MKEKVWDGNYEVDFESTGNIQGQLQVLQEAPQVKTRKKRDMGSLLGRWWHGFHLVRSVLYLFSSDIDM